MSAAFQNRLLRSIADQEPEFFKSDLLEVELLMGQVIEPAATKIEHVFFPESGVLSVVSRSVDSQVETGMIGFEGMSGLAVVLGNHQSPNECNVVMEGRAFRLPASRLREMQAASPALRGRLQRYALAFMSQVSQTAFANAKASLETRLARWLLMAQDRHSDDELRLTHEFLAVALSVRRPGVTDAIHALESKGVIEASRGVIRIAQRKGLMAIAGSTYGLPEAEYERLLGA